MDLSTLAAWGEFIGGIAVVISLVYLATQIRQNSRMLKSTATLALGDSDVQVTILRIEHPDLDRILREGGADLAALSEEERAKYNGYVDLMLRVLQRNFFFARDGVMDEAIWQGELQAHRALFQMPGTRIWWAESRDYFGKEFARFVDQYLADIGDPEGVSPKARGSSSVPERNA